MNLTQNHASPVIEDPWTELRRFTAARIAVGRCGSSLPLAESLAFRLDHARARDAVHSAFRSEALAGELHAAGITCLQLESEVADRMEYLTRPDKGRRLSARSRTVLAGQDRGCDLCLVVGDGLSARAMHENAVPFVRTCLLMFARAGLKLGPVSLVANARVAIADEIGRLLGARVAVMAIGERPGLSSPNSMGVYMTLDPKPGTTDERRNCISNVRPGGLPVEEGARKLAWLVEEALRRNVSGVELKDRMTADYLPFGFAMPEIAAR